MDLNVQTRQALGRIRGAEPLHLKVGLNDLEITTLDGALVEKKVPLPRRWLNGFAEVQIAASQMQPHAELTGVEARRFLRSLPASARHPLWVVPAGTSLRLTSRPAYGASCLTDPSRLNALEPLLRLASSMRLYGPPVGAGTESAPSAWELTLPGARLVIVLSPTPSRGFAGEGAVLNDLSDPAIADAADVLSASLAWHPRIDVSDLARDSGLGEPTVVRALTYLSASGRVGPWMSTRSPSRTAAVGMTIG